MTATVFRKYLGPDHPALSFFYIGAASCTDKLDEQEDLLKEVRSRICLVSVSRMGYLNTFAIRVHQQPAINA